MQMTSLFTMMFWRFFASLVLACACGRAAERASRVGEVTGYGGATAYEDGTLKTFGGSVGYPSLQEIHEGKGERVTA